jgi:hypothetical protein
MEPIGNKGVKFLLGSERQKKKYRALCWRGSSTCKKGTKTRTCIKDQGEEREEVREKGPMRSKEENNERTGDMRGIGREKRTVRVYYRERI